MAASPCPFLSLLHSILLYLCRWSAGMAVQILLRLPFTGMTEQVLPLCSTNAQTIPVLFQLRTYKGVSSEPDIIQNVMLREAVTRPAVHKNISPLGIFVN